MTLFEQITAELERTEERLNELKIALRVIESLEPAEPRPVRLKLIAEEQLEPTVAVDLSRAPILAELLTAEVESESEAPASAQVIVKRGKNEWTAGEVATLEADYPAVGLPGVVPLLPRHSKLSIKAKVGKMGLKVTGSSKVKRAWTSQEDRVLATVYPSGGVRAVIEALPHRSEQSIYNRVSYKGVVRAAPFACRSVPQPSESLTIPKIAERSGRTFEEQLERVSRGEVGIGPAFHPRRPPPDSTLGGVTGEIL